MSDNRKIERQNYWKEKAGIPVDAENTDSKKEDLAAIARKNRSNERIQKMQIPICEGLPIIEEELKNDLKSLDVICKRAIASLISIQLACDIDAGNDYEQSREFLKNLLKNYDVEDYLNSKEKRLFDGSYTKQDAIDVAWTYKSYWAIAWALGLINDDISVPNTICDCNRAIKLVSESKDYEDFKSKCKLKDVDEILELLDLHYRYHWACVEKRINPSTNIADLNPEVVYERRRGLEWLFSEEDDWFDISLDT
jgi:hypothetical protein